MIHVLLVEDNPGDTRLIRELFAEAKGVPTALLCADRLSSGLQQITEGGVDVVLLDLSLPDSKGFSTYTKLREKAKDLPVILLTGLDDEELAIRAVREGAQDYLVKGSVTAQSLARAVRFAVARQKTLTQEVGEPRRTMRGRIIGFLGAKGGVGTTTVVLNTAAVLAQQQKSVIALDLRSYGSSFAQQTHLEPSRNLGHLLGLDIQQITETEIKSCLVTMASGAKGIFSPRQADEYKEMLPSQAEAIIRCAAMMADFVIVDLPPQFSHDSQAAICCCDLVTVVVEREPASVAAGRLAIQLLERSGMRQGSIAGAIVIKNALASFMSLEDLESKLGCRIAGAIPPADEVFSASVYWPNKKGLPIVLLEPDSLVASSLTNLAYKLAEPTLVGVAGAQGMASA